MCRSENPPKTSAHLHAHPDDYGVELHFETHRHCMTNDMFPTLQLLDAVPEMTMVGDLSHYMVGREFGYPLSERDAALVNRLLQRCESFQGRVASREQVQVQINFPQHAKWLELFTSWWRDGFRLWHARHRHAKKPKVLNFICELVWSFLSLFPATPLILVTPILFSQGPPEYAITGADGYELSDRWEESKQLMDIARELWVQTAAEEAARTLQSL